MDTSCVKCGSDKFKLLRMHRRLDKCDRLYLVECASCSHVVDVLDLYGIGDWNDIKRHAYRDVVRELIYDMPAVT